MGCCTSASQFSIEQYQSRLALEDYRQLSKTLYFSARTVYARLQRHQFVGLKQFETLFPNIKALSPPLQSQLFRFLANFEEEISIQDLIKNLHILHSVKPQDQHAVLFALLQLPFKQRYQSEEIARLCELQREGSPVEKELGLQQFKEKMCYDKLLKLLDAGCVEQEVQKELYDLIRKEGFSKSLRSSQEFAFVVEARWLKDWFYYYKEKSGKEALGYVLPPVSNHLLERDYPFLLDESKQLHRDFELVEERHWNTLNIFYSCTREIKHQPIPCKLVAVSLFDGKHFKQLFKFSCSVNSTLSDVGAKVMAEAKQFTKHRITIYMQLQGPAFQELSEDDHRSLKQLEGSLLLVVATSEELRRVAQASLKAAHFMLGRKFQVITGSDRKAAQVVQLGDQMLRVHIQTFSHACDIKVDPYTLRKKLELANRNPIRLDSEGSYVYRLGLPNIGNSCYINAALQALHNFLPFRNFILNLDLAELQDQTNSSFAVSSGVQKLFTDLFGESKPNMHGFKKLVSTTFPSFAGRSQQDAQQFITKLLEQLAEELRSPLSCYNFIDDCFSGSQASIIRCRGCHNQTRKLEPFYTISLPVQNEGPPVLNVALVRNHILDTVITFSIPKKQLTFNKFFNQLKEKVPDPSKFMLADVVNNKIAKLIEEWKGSALLRSVLAAESGFVVLYPRVDIEMEAAKFRRQAGTLCDYLVKEDEYSFGLIKQIKAKSVVVQDMQSGFMSETTEIVALGSKTRESSAFSLQCLQVVFLGLRFDFKALPLLFRVFRFLTVSEIYHSLCHQICQTFKVKRNDFELRLVIGDAEFLCIVCREPATQFDHCEQCMEHIEFPFWRLKDSSEMRALAIWKDSVPTARNDLLSRQHKLTLEHCLQRYFAEEKIEFRCGNCGHDSAAFLHRIERAPNVLLVHLKRFTFQCAEMLKINSPVQFPKELDIGAFLETEGVQEYELNSVILHYGNESSGHYVALLRDECNRWLLANDEQVKLVALAPNHFEAAYMLHYTKVQRAGSIELFSL